MFPKYETWMEEFIAINSNPKIKMVGIPMTRKEYHKTYFSKDTKPQKIYQHYKKIYDPGGKELT